MFDHLPQIWNGTLREHYIFLFSVAGSIALIAGFIGSWFGARFASKRMILELRDSLPSADLQHRTNLHLDELSTAVDTMSIEIERLSEGQRFTAKLLAEESLSRASSPARHTPGVITPH